MNQNEAKIQIYLHEQESELGFFYLQTINAKRVNYKANGRQFMMNDREKLFARFFQEELAFVANLSDADLAVHIEELNAIAFEARAKLSGAAKEKGDRNGKRTSKGLLTSIETDELTQNAINNIKSRSEKLSKREQQIENMVKMGMDREDAEKLFSPGHVKQKLHELSQSQSPQSPQQQQSKQLSNPFAKKATTTEVTIVEETNTVIVEEKKEEVKSTLVNPFKK